MGIIDWGFTDYANVSDNIGSFTQTEDLTETGTAHNMLCQDINEGAIVPLPEAATKNHQALRTNRDGAARNQCGTASMLRRS